MSLSKGTAFILGLTSAVLLMKSCCMISEATGAISKSSPETQYEYKLTGTSELTGERVLAFMEEDPSDRSKLSGIVHDKTQILHIHGFWRGKGLVYARSITSTYKLEVISK